MDAMERRREAIVRLVNEKGAISFAGLKEAFPQVSEMTLRTDLKALDGEKKLLRVHGGAKSVQAVIGTDGFLEGRSVPACRTEGGDCRKGGFSGQAGYDGFS